MIETLGSRLKQLRNSKRLRQDQVAELIGVNKTAVSYYESDTRQPSYATLIRFASIYNVSTDYLLGVKSQDMLSVSGLSTADIIVVENLIQVLAEKNRHLQDYENKYGNVTKGYEVR